MDHREKVRAAAAEHRRLSDEATNAASRMWQHVNVTRDKSERLSEIESAIVAHRIEVALGLEPADELPDFQKLEELRTDVAIGEPVRLKLEAECDSVRAKADAAEKKYKEAVSAFLLETAVEPALSEWHLALG